MVDKLKQPLPNTGNAAVNATNQSKPTNSSKIVKCKDLRK